MALHTGNPICAPSKNGIFPPFRIWAAHFPFCHHLHHCPDPPGSALGPGRTRPRAPASKPHPSPRWGMWAPRHHRPPVEDGLVTPLDQRKQAGHARGGLGAIRKAGWSLHTPPCSYQRSGLSWMPQFWMVTAYSLQASTLLKPLLRLPSHLDICTRTQKQLCSVFIWYIIH